MFIFPVFFLLVREMSWVFLIFILRLLSSIHFEMFWRSVLSEISISDFSLCEEYIVVSSAYRWILQDFTTFGRSFTNITKRSGPRIEPWGTPLVRAAHLDAEEFEPQNGITTTAAPCAGCAAGWAFPPSVSYPVYQRSPFIPRIRN